jgi:transcriptional regulator with XRE-family HTH domain
MNIGKAMQMIREENGLSRPEMAKKLTVTAGALWKIENNKTKPKPATIDYFCFVTRTPLARLYLLALEARDFAPYASVKDCCTAMRESGKFTEDEMESIAKRLIE